MSQRKSSRIKLRHTSVEERLTTLEQELAHIKQQLTPDEPQITTAWWKKIVGVYRNDPEFDAAERLGREYRESLHPNDVPDLRADHWFL